MEIQVRIQCFRLGRGATQNFSFPIWFPELEAEIPVSFDGRRFPVGDNENNARSTLALFLVLNIGIQGGLGGPGRVEPFLILAWRFNCGLEVKSILSYEPGRYIYTRENIAGAPQRQEIF